MLEQRIKHLQTLLISLKSLSDSHRTNTESFTGLKDFPTAENLVVKLSKEHELYIDMLQLLDQFNNSLKTKI